MPLACAAAQHFQIWTSVFVMSGHPLTTDDEKTQNLTLHSEHLGWLLPELSLKKKHLVIWTHEKESWWTKLSFIRKNKMV